MAQVKKYKAEVISILNPIENIYTVEFKSNSGLFKFLPGQFLHLALDEYDPSSGWPESRCFSIQSSPNETNLTITYSVKGEFTKRMANEIETGKVFDLKLPFGDLFQNNFEKENVVFIAGGTGITPFLSLFADASFEHFINAELFFGIRSLKYNIYSRSLKNAIKINQSFKINIQNEEIDGLLNIDQIYIENKDKFFFISGPQLMISNFKEKLILNGVESKKILTDDWN